MAIFRYVKEGFLGHITFSNQAGRFSSEALKEETGAIRKFLNDEEIKGTIIYCSDLSSISDKNTFETFFSNPELSNDLFDCIRCAPVPAAALLEGCCSGFLVRLALSCHFRIAAANTVFDFSRITDAEKAEIGSITGKAGKSALISSILTNADMRGTEAHEKGLIDVIVENGNAASAAADFVTDLVQKHDRKVIGAVMQCFKNHYCLTQEEALHEETRLFCRLAENYRQHA
jgi:enoyl-CoA hydratase/carnithine racemase